MKQAVVSSNVHDILDFVNKLPKKMVMLHNRGTDENVCSFVLHDLCHDSCFKVDKAAYFVDNPDFNCFKGLAGICKHELPFDKGCQSDVIWHEPEKYQACLAKSPFHQQVCAIMRQSITNKADQTKILEDIARELHINNPCYLHWDMKHHNHGFLMFENNEEMAEVIKKHLPECVYLLSFCPVH